MSFNHDRLKYATFGMKTTSKNKYGVISFVFAAIGFVLIVFSFFNLKTPYYSSLTDGAFALLVVSIITGAIAKRKSKKASSAN